MRSEMNEKIKNLPLLSFNDVKGCCADDSAGGGCLYLDEQKLEEKVTAKIQAQLDDAHALQLNNYVS
jgi:hypothetical protein